MDFPTLTEEEETALLSTAAIEVEAEPEPEETVIEPPAPEPEPVVEAPAAAPAAPPAPETPDAWARMRYEATQERKRADALAAEVERLKAPAAPAIPSPEENLGGHLQGKLSAVEQDLAEFKSWKQKQEKEINEQAEYSGAVNELRAIEQHYTTVAPDYNEAANHLRGMIATSIKMLNPGIQPEELAKRTIKEYLSRGGTAVLRGLNPAEAIYKEALSIGYRKTTEAAPIQDNAARKPDLDTIAANKKRSAGMAGTGGGAKPPTSGQAAVEMSNEEFSRLSSEETQRLLGFA